MHKKSDKQLLEQIGSNIRKYRLKQKISQSQLAFEINTSLRQIQRIEKGSYNAGILFYLKIAYILDISFSTLIKET